MTRVWLSCLRCRHFMGLTTDMLAVCKKLGYVKPRVGCRYFEFEER
jgi:hypothetical protein